MRLFHPFTTGLHRVSDTQRVSDTFPGRTGRGLWVYISRGTGYWGPPQRLGAPSEITYLRLVPALPSS